MNELDMMRGETIVELSNEIITSVKKILLSHGPDPQLVAILAAGYTMSINEIEKQSPGFSKFMVKMLEKEDE
jgi:hypothetical protein